MSTFEALVADLRRDAHRAQPNDPLQFCANWFQQRLEEQRARSQSVLAQAPASASSANVSIDPRSRGTFMSRSAYNVKPNSYSPFGTLDVPGNALLPHQANAPISFNVDGIRPELPRSDGPSGPMNPGDYLHPPASTLGRRTSVSAETIQVNSSHNEPLPSYPKSPEQLRRIRSAISGNFIFRDIADEQMRSVLAAMEEIKVKHDEVVIRQGDTGDYFYVVEEGILRCFIRPDPPPPPSLATHQNGSQGPKAPAGYHPDFGKQVAECKPGDSFGELALMYGHPRAATVLSIESCTLWRLDRITFRTIILKAAHRRRTMYEHFLGTVPLLSSLLPEERSKIADSLISKTFADGEAVVREGDMGDSFFIVEEGEGTVTKRVQGDDGEWRDEVKTTLRRGDYFGELSLLRLAPRAATVSAVVRTNSAAQPKLKVAALKAPAFTRLLGPLRELMERNAEQAYSSGNQRPRPTR